MISEVHPLIQYLSFLCSEQSRYNINTRYFGNEMNILQNLNPYYSNSLQYNINPYVVQLINKSNGNNHLLLQKNQYFNIRTKNTKKLKKNLVRYESPNQEKIQMPRSHINWKIL